MRAVEHDSHAAVPGPAVDSRQLTKGIARQSCHRFLLMGIPLPSIRSKKTQTPKTWLLQARENRPLSNYVFGFLNVGSACFVWKYLPFQQNCFVLIMVRQKANPWRSVTNSYADPSANGYLRTAALNLRLNL